jgi:hypothetical protein
MKLIQFNATNKRLTWRLTNEVHSKMAKIGKASGLSQEELGNIILDHVQWEDIKGVLSTYVNEKKKVEDSKKRASDTVSSLSPELLERMSSMSPEDLAKLLGE